MDGLKVSRVTSQSKEEAIRQLFSNTKVLANGCLVWLGLKTTAGYGQIWCEDKLVYTHRLAFEHYNGYLPDQTDHNCKNKACVAKAHLEDVTQAENNRRNAERGVARNGNSYKLKCIHGHLLNDNNVYLNNGRRHCRLCRMLRRIK